jgi:fatty-acyl-CoA synthase
MGTLTFKLPLWPAFGEPADLAEVEQIALSERGLPASTYELVTRAAERWPDRPAVSLHR